MALGGIPPPPGYVIVVEEDNFQYIFYDVGIIHVCTLCVYTGSVYLCSKYIHVHLLAIA